jgi:nicotinamidase-related amidase
MPLVDRSDSVLTIVDAQPAFFDQAKMTEDERATAAATVDRIAWLAGVASLLDIPVVVVEEGADRNGATDPRILERLGPNSSVHGKSTFSLTGCDAAVDAVRATGKSTVVVVGFETDVCVAQSAVGLHELGLRAVVVEDATYAGRAAPSWARPHDGRGRRVQPLQRSHLRVASHGLVRVRDIRCGDRTIRAVSVGMAQRRG